jgi:protein-tyrosine phosphatase
MDGTASPYRFDHLLNFRDIGTTINTFANTTTLKPRIFYRSALPDGASEADRAQLTRNLGIKTIIDLRSKTEHIEAAKKHASSASSAIFESAIIPQTNEHVSSPLRMPGVDYVDVNLNGGAFERALLWQLKCISLARLVWLMMVGYREDAISILGREVMLKRGLIGLGMDTLDYSTHEIKDIFDVLANDDSYPVMVHCTQGKDRTGLIVLLVLMLCGVDQTAIAHDYMRSEEELEVEKEGRLQEILRIGLSEEFAGCPDAFVNDMTKHLQERYGGVEKYLNSVGVDATAQRSVRNIMLQEAASSGTLLRTI